MRFLLTLTLCLLPMSCWAEKPYTEQELGEIWCDNPSTNALMQQYASLLADIKIMQADINADTNSIKNLSTPAVNNYVLKRFELLEKKLELIHVDLSRVETCVRATQNAVDKH